MRKIQDILLFRQDISPFLVHLTRNYDNQKAKDILKSIISSKQLIASNEQISDARFGTYTTSMSIEEKAQYFGAICFTETPINEIHCLLEIRHRSVDLSPYGLVFLKERLEKKGVSPVVYLNNEKQDKEPVVVALCDLIKNNPSIAAEFLPLISVFGNKLRAPGSSITNPGRIDFRWEREWRFPQVKGPLDFKKEDVFIGLCKDEDISEFERMFPDVYFIDPMRNMKWYADKLIQSRQRLDLKYSVV